MSDTMIWNRSRGLNFKIGDWLSEYCCSISHILYFLLIFSLVECNRYLLGAKGKLGAVLSIWWVSVNQTKDFGSEIHLSKSSLGFC